MRSWRTCGRSAARSSPVRAVTSLDELPPAARNPLRSLARAVPPDRGPRACRPRIAAGSSGTATAWGCSRWTGRSTGRFRGPPRPARGAATVHVGGTLDGDRRVRARRVGGPARRAAVRAAGAADAVRSVARAGGTAHRVGLLPRAARVDRRHAAADRSADRALRAWLPRPHPRAARHDRPRRSSGTTRTTSAATSPPASPIRAAVRATDAVAVLDAGARACISAPRPRRPAWACTACAAITRRSVRSMRCCATEAITSSVDHWPLPSTVDSLSPARELSVAV